MMMRIALGIVAATVALFVALDATAKCSRQMEGASTRTDIDSIAVEGTADGRPVDQTAINGGAAQWDDCDGTPDVKTNQTTSQNGQLNVDVRFRSGTNPGTIPLVTGGNGNCGTGCGCVQLHGSPANSATVYSYQKNASLAICNTAQLIAHELGHVLGLADRDRANCGLCIGRVMAPSTLGGPVNQEDCMNADDLWVVPEEQGAPSPHPCRGQNA